MKLTIPRGVLDEIRKGMSKVISSRTSKAVYQHIKVESAPGRLRAIGTDAETALVFDAPIEENTDGSGMCLIPVKEVSNIPGANRDVATVTAEEGKTTAEVMAKGAVERVHFRVPGVSDFPEIEMPSHLKFRPQGEGSAGLIRSVAGCVDVAPTRHSLNCLALERHRIVATNGRKLFAANSFAFPWRGKQPKLVPASKVFGYSSVVDAGELSVASADDAVYFRFGDRWTFKLSVVEGSYPDWEHVVSKKAKASIEFTEEDATQLIDRLPALPGADDHNAAVRLTMDGSVRITARGEEGQSETLDLPNAKTTGRKAEIGFNRAFLIDGLKMGLRRFDVAGPSDPVVARDERKMFLFMPIVEAEPETKPENKGKTMTTEKDNSHGNSGSDMDTIMAQLTTVKETAKQLVGSITEFEKALKTCASDLRKRERLVKSTISSLKGLKELSA